MILLLAVRRVLLPGVLVVVPRRRSTVDTTSCDSFNRIARLWCSRTGTDSGTDSGTGTSGDSSVARTWDLAGAMVICYPGMLLRYYTVLYGMSDAKTASVPSVRLLCWRENGCELFLVFAEFDSMDYSSRTLNPPQRLITCLVWWRLTDGLTKGWTAGRSPGPSI